MTTGLSLWRWSREQRLALMGSFAVHLALIGLFIVSLRGGPVASGSGAATDNVINANDPLDGVSETITVLVSLHRSPEGESNLASKQSTTEESAKLNTVTSTEHQGPLDSDRIKKSSQQIITKTKATESNPRRTAEINSEQSDHNSPSALSGQLGSQGADPGGGNGSGGALDRARVISAPKPNYPDAARQIGFEGRVLLNVSIDSSGNVSDVSIFQSSGREDCDLAARDVLLNRWRFAPATKDGVSIATTERIAVVYQLDRRSG